MEQGINISQNESKNSLNKPLGITGKIWCFALPGVLKLAQANRLRSSGCEKRADEIRAWTVYGFEFYIFIFLILIIYKSI